MEWDTQLSLFEIFFSSIVHYRCFPVDQDDNPHHDLSSFRTLTCPYWFSFLGRIFPYLNCTLIYFPPPIVALSMAADRRVVVTGMGIVSCLGNTLEDVKKSLHEAEPGITFQEQFAELGIKSQVAGVPALTEDDVKELIPKAALRFMGTNAQYAYIALDRAIQDSKLTPEEYQENPRVAAIIGQGGTSIPDIVETCDAVLEGGKRWKNKVGPFRVTRSMGSTCSAVLATNFKVQGPSFSISSACSTGAHCIGTGFEQIKLDKCDIAFCGAGTFFCYLFFDFIFLPIVSPGAAYSFACGRHVADPSCIFGSELLYGQLLWNVGASILTYSPLSFYLLPVLFFLVLNVWGVSFGGCRWKCQLAIHKYVRLYGCPLDVVQWRSEARVPCLR